MIREQDSIAFCSLSMKQQAALFVIICSLLGWSVFTSFYFVRYNPILAKKSDDLKRLGTEYSDLKNEMRTYTDYMNQMIGRMDETEKKLEVLQNERRTNDAEQPKIRKVDLSSGPAEKNDLTADEAERLQSEATALKERASLIRDKMADISNRDGFFADKEKISFHNVRLQRDIAISETQSLREKVAELEKLISSMQEAEFLAFRKMATVAENNITAIENGFSDVKQSLSAVGVGMDSLLRRIRRDKEEIGIGGPFIPMPMPKPQHDLNISLISLNQLLDYWYDLATLQNVLPLGKPVERIRVTSAFGSRGDPFQGSPARHEAVDLGGMIGEPLYATAPGKVVRTGNWGWYGNMVEIDHGLGFRTRYAHMEKIFVTKGETVQAGDRLGTMGNTGRSTGPHLHYEIRIRGNAVDPMNFIKAKKNVFKN